MPATTFNSPLPSRSGLLTGLVKCVVAASLAVTCVATAAPSALLVTGDKAQSGDGWVRFDNGQKQWVTAACRADLESEGLAVEVLPWPAIDSIAYTSVSETCSSLIDSLSGGDPGSGTDIVVTQDKSTTGDGWVRYANGTKQWIDAACRAQLAQSGVAVSVLSWPVIDALAYTTTPKSCDEIGDENSGDDSNNRIVVTSDKASSGDGFVQFGAGDKQWISAACRSELDSAGWTTKVQPWPIIDALPYRAVSLSCAALVDLADGGGGGGGVVVDRFVTTSDKSTTGYGWVVFPNNTKQWVDASCRTSLVAQGLAVNVLSWPSIDAIAEASAPVSCANLTVSDDDDNPSCAGTQVFANEDLATVVANAPNDTTFCIRNGVHRPSVIYPKTGQQFICESGAVLNGSTQLTGEWVQQGTQWRYAGAPVAVRGLGFPGRNQTDIVQVVNDLFINDQPLRRVDTLSKVNASADYFDGELMYAGTFYQDADVLYVAVNPNSSKVEFATTQWAFLAQSGTSDNGLLENCTIEKYASADQRGAIDLTFSDGWVVRNVTAQFNHSGGLRAGTNTQVIGGRYNHNGQIGIMGARNDDVHNGRSADVAISGVEAAYNNYLEFDPLYHAGGIKFFRTANLTVNNNQIHHNYGVGLWIDTDVLNAQLYDNDIVKNGSVGIELEATFFGDVYNNNILCNARFARQSLDRVWFWASAIMVKNGFGYNIRNNTIIVDEGQGIGVVDNGYRGDHPTYGPRRSANNNVFNNTISFIAKTRSGFFDGRTGVESDDGAKEAGLDATAPSASNALYANTYQFSDAAYTHWRYDGSFHTSTTIPAQWESGSTFSQLPVESLLNLCD